MKRGFQISPGFCMWAAVMILTLPLNWLLAAVCAAAVHEAFHLLAIRLFGSRSAVGELRAWNAGISLPQLGRGKELLCALCGPAGGFLLCSLWAIWPEIAICGFLQSLYNLLPIYPMDGGRALHCLCAMLLPPHYAHLVSLWIGWICTGALLAAGAYYSLVCHVGMLPLLIGTVAAIKANYACKERDLALQ